MEYWSKKLSKLIAEKSNPPEKILPALKSDLRDLLRQYGELCDDINIEIDTIDNKYCLVMLATFNRFVG